MANAGANSPEKYVAGIDAQTEYRLAADLKRLIEELPVKTLQTYSVCDESLLHHSNALLIQISSSIVNIVF